MRKVSKWTAWVLTPEPGCAESMFVPDPLCPDEEDYSKTLKSPKGSVRGDAEMSRASAASGHRLGVLLAVFLVLAQICVLLSYLTCSGGNNIFQADSLRSWLNPEGKASVVRPPSSIGGGAAQGVAESDSTPSEIDPITYLNSVGDTHKAKARRWRKGGTSGAVGTKAANERGVASSEDGVEQKAGERSSVEAQAVDTIDQEIEKPSEEASKHGGEALAEAMEDEDRSSEEEARGSRADRGSAQTKSLEATPKPVDAGSKPVDAGSKPVDAGSKPVHVAPKPVDAGSKPVDVAPTAIEVAPTAIEVAPITEPFAAVQLPPLTRDERICRIDHHMDFQGEARRLNRRECPSFLSADASLGT
eukprot:scaffold1637_cov253-Pinguiococcus_pyrenoidosus.AAC.10